MLDADRLRPCCVAVIRGRESACEGNHTLRSRVRCAGSWNWERIEDEEVEVPLHEAARVPVKGKGRQDSKEERLVCGVAVIDFYSITHQQRESNRHSPDRGQPSQRLADDEQQVQPMERPADDEEQVQPSQRKARDKREQRTEETDTEQQANRLLSLRADRLRALGQLAAGIAHELNQPLVGVRGLAEHLLIGMDRGWNLSEEKIRDKLSLIIQQADRMTHIIQRVRTFASGAGKPETCLVHANDVVQGTMSMLGSQMRERGIELDSELAVMNALVRVNPMSLEEVVLNLVVNAADALSELTGDRVHSTSHRILVCTRNTRLDNQEYVQIQVIDRGVGIPENLLPRLFEPFLTTKGPDRGTGLGLVICKDLVEQVNGTIGIESAVGHGTTVTVTLPAVTGDHGESS